MKWVVLLVFVGVVSGRAQRVDLVIRGGRVVTMDAAVGRETAESVAVAGGRSNVTSR